MISPALFSFVLFFFFNDTATTEIYTLSLHDALPIYPTDAQKRNLAQTFGCCRFVYNWGLSTRKTRSEEHTSELQSRLHLVCRLLLEKKKNHTTITCSTRLRRISSSSKYQPTNRTCTF